MVYLSTLIAVKIPSLMVVGLGRATGHWRNNLAKMSRKNLNMSPSELQHLQTRIAQWQSRHRDVERLRAAYRRRLINLTLHSMAFEREPVDSERLKQLLSQRAQNH